MGSHRDKTWPDGWTAVTEDGQRSAQFEHQVGGAGCYLSDVLVSLFVRLEYKLHKKSLFSLQILITEDGCEVLTARLPTSPPLWWEKEGT